MKERIKRMRKHQGLTQAEFASLLNVSVRTVQNWESGMEPSAKIMRRLALVTGKPVSWFYEDEVAVA